MKYTLHQFEVFFQVARLQSITKAAEVLHLTQPAVSIQLKQFQQQFDLPLTEVVGRKIYVTEFGREVAQSIGEILNGVQTLEHLTHSYKGLLSGKLRISVVSTGKYVMPYFLNEFIRLHPHVELLIDVTNKSKVIESLEANEVDFSLVSILPQTFKVEQIDLIPNELVMVGGKKTGITPRATLQEILDEYPLIFREQGSGTRTTMEKFLNLSGVVVRKRMELATNEAVKQAVLAGLGCSIMPVIGIREELKSGKLKIIPLKGLPIRTTWSLIWMKGKKQSPVAEAYRRFLQASGAGIAEQFFSDFPNLRIKGA